MSATDNAFIKIYKQDKKSSTPRPAFAGGMRSDKHGITVAASQMELSRVVASAGNATLPSDTELLDHEAKTRLRAESSSAAASRAGVERIDSDSPHDESARLIRQDSSRTAWRQDSSHAPSPHIDAAKFKPGLRVEALATNESSPTRFHPAWEVDRFRWPSICNDLQRDWAAPLTGVVRSVVREAWRGGNIVAVTQFGRMEGATTLALCLARIAASFHIRVALVDGNTQNPDIGQSLGLKCEAGWEMTQSAEPLEEHAIGSIEDRLVVLPLNSADPESPNPNAGGRRAMLERLSGEFELVVVDTGPVFAAAHDWFSQPCVGKIGSALIVRDVRRTDTVQLDDVCSRLRAAGVGNMSVVENFQFG